MDAMNGYALLPVLLVRPLDLASVPASRAERVPASAHAMSRLLRLALFAFMTFRNIPSCAC